MGLNFYKIFFRFNTLPFYSKLINWQNYFTFFSQVSFGIDIGKS